MRINRYELLELHNPVLHQVERDSPLTLGNGEFAYTADVTGMQSLYAEYADSLPLCTMSQWGWHTEPAKTENGCYTLSDLHMTEYEYRGRKVFYPKERFKDNEIVYDWLRQNPHRLNLGIIGLEYRGAALRSNQITNIHQELELYTGLLQSNFEINSCRCHVETFCGKHWDSLGFKIDSSLLSAGDLSVVIAFPYGSSAMSASDWNNPQKHTTKLYHTGKHEFYVKRQLDADSYEAAVQSVQPIQISCQGHRIVVSCNSNSLEFTVSFSGQKVKAQLFDFIRDDCICGWKCFWEKGGIIRLNKSRDARAFELERRIILSQYLMAVNCTGDAPPQETGLTCNSWYGKMHLEMYLWHCAWLPLWNHTEELEKSLNWFFDHRKAAERNAAKNGFKGARWPKMVAIDGIDSPSPVAPLLIWQQPHLIFILELAYNNVKSQSFLLRYWPLVRETAEFMEDFAVYDTASDTYNLLPPLIPAQECHNEMISKNPVFELEYWRMTLEIACRWAVRLEIKPNAVWKKIAEKLAAPATSGGVYLAHENCPDTFEKYNQDHPSMLGAYGLLNSGRIDKTVMAATLRRVINGWHYETLWGWDFAMIAMTATRLGKPEIAIDVLLKDTYKNRYVTSGNNKQGLRTDLPLYLPGNGSLLLALPLMVMGYPGCTTAFPGFPHDGSWVIESENLMPYFA